MVYLMFGFHFRQEWSAKIKLLSKITVHALISYINVNL